MNTSDIRPAWLCPQIQTRKRAVPAVLSVLAVLTVLILAGCGSPASSPGRPAEPVRGSKAGAAATAPVLPPAGSGRGGYYQDDGPGDAIPAGLAETPDATPVIESYNQRNNRPYTVFGKTYVPLIGNEPYSERGTGSWYGKKFHNAKTASGEKYDMYAMTAAHPTLPIPSYARVTNLSNGVSVIVRVNDRGPFKSSRIIDLSYTAALKLGYLQHGSSMLQVDRLLPADIGALQRGEQQGAVAMAPRQLPPPPLVPSAVSDREPAASSAAAPADLVAMMTSPSEPVPPSRSTAQAAQDVTEGRSEPEHFTENILPDQTTAAPVTTLASGFYLQLGAFAQRDNALKAQQQLQASLPVLGSRLQIQDVGPLTKVVAGPYPERTDAEQLRDQIGHETGTLPVIVQIP